ncbi:MAG: hypothetical protein ACRD15_06050 [Vicinamibacterales bacterium]
MLALDVSPAVRALPEQRAISAPGLALSWATVAAVRTIPAVRRVV